jgi:glycosyltransferase involved in cell wall biosynthesis
LKRLAIITTHPIQYNAPWFKLLALRGNVQVKVFYTWEQSQQGSLYDPGFGKNVSWDIPLLDGYDYTFVKNVSANPGSHHFKGIVNPTLIDEVKLWKADAILFFGWSFKSHLKCLRFFHKKIPVLFRGDSTLLDESAGLKTTLRRIFLRWVYTSVDSALYVGTNNKLYFRKHGLNESQLCYAPHAIDNERFDRGNEVYKLEALALRQKLNIDITNSVFLFAGKLEAKKNPELLIQAFKELNDKSAHLVVVGNGEEEAQLKTKYAGLENLHFMDFQNQSKMPVIYNLCDVFVLPSKGPGETWGLAINEAMACRRAILASNKCGGAIDLIEDGKNGYIFESHSKDDLVRKLRKLAASREEVKLMGERSYKKVQHFSFENICLGIENCLQKIRS